MSLLITAIWGFNFVVIKYCLTSMSPLMLCVLRFFFASIPLVFFVPPPKIRFSLIALYGIVMFAIQFSLLFFGLYLGMEAGITSILLQSQVFFSLFIGIFVFKERIRSWHAVGCAISFLGIGIVIGNLDSSVTFQGFLPIIGAATCSSCGNFISKKIGNVNSLSLVAWGSLVAWPILAMMALIFEGPSSMMNTVSNLDQGALIGIFFITYISTLFAYAIWSWLIANYPLRTITPFTLLTPVFALICAVIFLNETLEAWKVLAAFFVLSGLAINIFGHHILRVPPPLD
ncbi:MAG: EamA family transporter [Chlamydiia bacterium]